MIAVRQRIVVLALATALLGCGGSLDKNGDGSTTAPCSSLGACECMAASDRCTPRSEACWCPTECYPGAPIECICGGGQFLACEERSVVTVCSDWLTAVESKCAGQPFVQYIDALCVQATGDPICTAGCLANLKETGSCSEIDCSFCPVCDCAEPAMPSPFAACLQACRTSPAARL
jgi:hypothetical protein